MAAVVSHATADDAAATTGTFTAARNQGGSRGQLGGVVHTGSALWAEGEEEEKG